METYVNYASIKQNKKPTPKLQHAATQAQSLPVY